LERAKQYVTELRGQVSQVWLVYDKDDFPPDRFDTTSYESSRLSDEGTIKYNVAWSNQCIEYWFLLHFENLQSNIGRTQYMGKLDEHFQKCGLERYKKNCTNMFSLLQQYGDIELAIRYAKKGIREHVGKSPTQSAPATRVHELVEELLRYLPKEVPTA